MGLKKLNIDAIRIDGGTQPRERINMEVVADYAEGVKVGIEFPPVVVFFDGAEYWLADGFHRWHAHKHAEKASIQARLVTGTLKEARLYAASHDANGAHGLRRTNADKRLCVLMTLAEAPDWSDNRVADHVGVDHKTVAAHRASILGNSQDAPTVRTAERGGKTYQQDTAKIGKSKLAKPPETPPAAASKTQHQAPTQTPKPADDFGPSDAEIAQAQREQDEELASLRKIAEADDKLKAALEENKQLRAQLRVMQERINSLTNEKAAAIRSAKSWQRKAEAHERAAA